MKKKLNKDASDNIIYQKDGTTVFVGGFDSLISQQMLQEYLESFGKLKNL